MLVLIQDYCNEVGVSQSLKDLYLEKRLQAIQSENMKEYQQLFEVFE